jgi:hypothetical protein
MTLIDSPEKIPGVLENLLAMVSKATPSFTRVFKAPNDSKSQEGVYSGWNQMEWRVMSHGDLWT